MGEADGKPVIRPLRDNEKAPEFQGLFGSFKLTVPRRGAEQSHDSPGKSTVAGQGDSQSDSLGVVSDPRLARLIEVWPALAEGVKGEMLTLAGLRPDDVDDFYGVKVGDDRDQG